MYITRFREDLVHIILSIFKKLEVNYYDPAYPPLKMNFSCEKFVSHFGKESRDRVLLRQFINLNSKYLNSYAWDIKVSTKLHGYKTQKHGHLIDFFIQKAQNAEELKGFLSKKSICAYDEDGLLNCWSIHHVHLSDEMEENGSFYKRSDHLLMIHQSGTTLYLIDVIPHDDKAKEPSSEKEVGLTFSRTSVIKTLIREFPEISESWKIHGVLGLAEELDDFDHQALRSKGLQTMIEVDGSVYSPGYGISTASTGIKTTIHTDMYIGMLSTWEKHIEVHFRSILSDLGLEVDVSRPALFRLVLRESGFIVSESSSNSFLRSMSEKEYFNRKPLGAK